jgi:DNA-binding beta-propeller fold protein YncE
MKSTRSRFPLKIAPILLCLLVFASVGFAATKKPLNGPLGIAVDAKGNLYVANFSGNNILVYSPNYTQVSSKTITQGIASPTAVAFDSPTGNLWVANLSSNSITEYTAGQQNTSATITDGIGAPLALAIDSLHDVWVQNSNINVTIYAPAIGLVRTLTPGTNVYGIAIGGEWFVWGNGSAMTYVYASPELLTGLSYGELLTDGSGAALAADAKNNFYFASTDGSVYVANPDGRVGHPFPQLPFVAAGIAIDNMRGRVYFSNYNGNSIAVYSTAGALLTTIQ